MLLMTKRLREVLYMYGSTPLKLSYNPFVKFDPSLQMPITYIHVYGMAVY